MAHTAIIRGNREFAHRSLTVSKECDHCGARFFRDKRCTWKHWERSRFCGRICSAQWKGARDAANRPSIEDAFWPRVERREPDECWPWAGALNKARGGYGAFSYASKSYGAHRLAFELTNGPVENGFYVCHKCGNPACCNPSHLYAGTAADNSRDKWEHGTQPMGVQIYCSKLDDVAVRAIRKDDRTNSAIAHDYEITPSNVSMIKSRKTWKHVA